MSVNPRVSIVRVGTTVRLELTFAEEIDAIELADVMLAEAIRAGTITFGVGTGEPEADAGDTAAPGGFPEPAGR